MRDFLVYFIIKILLKEDKEMAMVYATLIVKGKKFFKDVPKFLKEKVREILIDLDAADLAVEEGE